MASFPTQADLGLFLGTTAALDISQVYTSDFSEESFRELLVRLYQNANDVRNALNQKTTGIYAQQEFVNGDQYLINFQSGLTANRSLQPSRAFRILIDCGALPNAGTTNTAHNLTITSGYQFVNIYGAATDPSTAFIPLPFSSPTLNENIKLDVDATNVNITTAIDYSAYTQTWVVLEYIKS